MKRNPLTIAIAFVLIVVFGLLLFVYQVRKSEVAVVTFFGKTDRVNMEPGADLRWPWPIEKVYLLDQRIQNFEGKFEEIHLRDQNIIMLLTYVGWRIEDPKAFFPKFAGGAISEAEKSLEGLVGSAEKEVAGRHPFSDFVSADEKQMKFTQIENEMLQRAQQEVHDHNYGLEIKFIQIKKIALPESVSQTVFERMQSERQVHISQIQAQGELASTEIKSAADSEGLKLVADAEAKSLEIRGEGEAEMMKSLQVLQKNPDLANFTLKINAFEQLLKEKSTLILDQSTPPLDLLETSPQK